MFDEEIIDISGTAQEVLFQNLHKMIETRGLEYATRIYGNYEVKRYLAWRQQITRT